MTLEELKRQRDELDAQIRAIENGRVFMAKDVNRAWSEYAKSLGFKFKSLNDEDSAFPMGGEYCVGEDRIRGFYTDARTIELSSKLQIKLNEPLYQALKPWLRPDEEKVVDVAEADEIPILTAGQINEVLLLNFDVDFYGAATLIDNGDGDRKAGKEHFVSSGGTALYSKLFCNYNKRFPDEAKLRPSKELYDLIKEYL